MKLCFGTKQGLAAADALISSLGFRVLVFAGERRLRSLLPRYIVLILRELFLPRGFVLAYLFFHSFPSARISYFCVAISDSPYLLEGSTSTSNTVANTQCPARCPIRDVLHLRRKVQESWRSQ